MKKLVISVAVASAVMLQGVGVASAKSPSRSCMKALDSAEQIINVSEQFTEAVGSFFKEVSQSASSNSDGTIDETAAFLSDMTDSASTLTDTTNTLAPQLNTYGVAYKAAAARCRAGR